MNLRPTDPAVDGIGVTETGELSIREDGSSAGLVWLATPENWILAMRNQRRMEEQIRRMQEEINSRSPSEFLQKILQELREKADEANRLAQLRRGKDSSPADRIMWGQAQAYRDAVASIESHLPR